jgi:SAM-dependent methyltransferase
MSEKDYFSKQSGIYAAFRPVYPQTLYDFIYKHLKQSHSAWDCGTGNGQVAHMLATKFDHVYATDISQQQLDHAIQAPNVFYSISKAEQTSFQDRQFDLITVGQALHWFDKDLFFQEVKRTGKPGGLIAVWGYALLNISPEIDKLFLHFYYDIVGPYWDNARRLVEQEYNGLTFPFEIIPAPKFEIRVSWNLNQFEGYLKSWSATQKFINSNRYDPVDNFISNMKSVWPPEEFKTVSFPVFMKLGKIA